MEPEKTPDKPNDSRWNKTIRVIGLIPPLVIFVVWESLAFIGAMNIENENIYLSAFYTIINWAFIAVAGWYFCEALLNKFAIMD